MQHDIVMLQEKNTRKLILSYFDAGVSAGFPSPAADYMQEEIDLNTYLKPHPSSTFLIRVKGESMIDAFIPDGALLVIDRSITPSSNMIVLAVLDGELVLKRFVKNSSGIRLMPANLRYPPIPITDGMDFRVWGVVTQIIINGLTV